MCSNRAATRVNLLKCWERRQDKNTAICGSFAISRNPQQPIALPSHGRGRWFEPSIAHSQKRCFAGKALTNSAGDGVLPSSCAATQRTSRELYPPSHMTLGALARCPPDAFRRYESGGQGR